MPVYVESAADCAAGVESQYAADVPERGNEPEKLLQQGYRYRSPRVGALFNVASARAAERITEAQGKVVLAIAEKIAAAYYRRGIGDYEDVLSDAVLVGLRSAVHHNENGLPPESFTNHVAKLMWRATWQSRFAAKRPQRPVVSLPRPELVPARTRPKPPDEATEAFVNMALEGLPERHRDAITTYAFSNLCPAHSARIMGVSKEVFADRCRAARPVVQRNVLRYLVTEQLSPSVVESGEASKRAGLRGYEFMSDELWARAAAVLPANSADRLVNLRAIVDGILFRWETRCPWPSIPSSMPPWQTCLYHYRRWRADGTLAKLRQVFAGRVANTEVQRHVSGHCGPRGDSKPVEPLTEEQWAAVLTVLPPSRWTGNESYMRQVVAAVTHRDRTGCVIAGGTAGVSPNTVSTRTKKWRKDGTLDRLREVLTLAAIPRKPR